MIVGLEQFRAALRAAQGAAPTLLTAGLKRAGEPVLRMIQATAPRRTGRLASGYRTSVRGSRASIVSSVPYAGGAEWGARGKWRGFPGSPPRNVAPTIERNLDLIAEAVLNEMRDVVEAYGWFHR